VSYATSAGNTSTLNSQLASFYQNASNLNAGTIPDARLSTNIPVKGASGYINQKVHNTYSGLTLNGITISGLSGDSDVMWDIYIVAKMATVGEQWLYMRINGDTGLNYSFHPSVDSGAAAAPINSTSLQLGTIRNEQLSIFHLRFYPKTTGGWRLGWCENVTPYSGYMRRNYGLAWANTSSNITSIQFFSGSGIIADGATVTITRTP